MNYIVRQLHHLFYSPPPMPIRPFGNDNSSDDMNIDDDLLDSPLLRDGDDFDDFDDFADGGHALLSGGPAIGLSHLSPF